MSTPEEIKALAKTFFDCVESGDVDRLVACYAPGARIWHNTDGLEQSPEDNGRTLKGFVAWIADRRYDERRINVFPGGFVHQHLLRGVRRDGAAVSLPACIVCQVEDGKITRLDEYFDSAQVAEFTRAA